MTAQNKLTNLQLELLKVFSFDVSENDLLEIKTILSNYFLEKARDEADQLWDEKGWTEKTMREWAAEHMRTTVHPE